MSQLWHRPTSGSVVVTGAATGIGRAVALRLAAAGWRVVGVDRDAATLEEAGADWASPGSPSRLVVGDVRDDSVLAEAAHAAEEYGSLVAWVSNAALIELAALHEASTEHIDAMLAVDLRATLVGARLAVQSFLQKEIGGAVVAISSVHAQRAFAGWALYDACKGGLDSFARYLAAEYGRYGITGNCVSPGAVRTEREARARAARDDEHDVIPDWQLVEPDEVAATVEYLISPAGSAVNGQAITVDRGLVSTYRLPGGIG